MFNFQCYFQIAQMDKNWKKATLTAFLACSSFSSFSSYAHAALCLPYLSSVEFFNAVTKGDIDKVREYMKCQFVDVNYVDWHFGETDDRSALQAAIDEGHSEVVRALLEDPKTLVNFNPSLREDLNRAPLRLAIEFTDKRIATKMVQLFVKRPDLDVMCGYTQGDYYHIDAPLTRAAKLNRREIIQALLSHPKIKFQISEPDNGYGYRAQSALCVAIKSNYPAIFETLMNWLQVQAHQDQSFKMGELLGKARCLDITPVRQAIRSGNLAMLRSLLDVPGIFDRLVQESGYPNTAKTTPLEEAVALGDFDIIKELLKHPDIQVNHLHDKSRVIEGSRCNKWNFYHPHSPKSVKSICYPPQEEEGYVLKKGGFSGLDKDEISIIIEGTELSTPEIVDALVTKLGFKSPQEAIVNHLPHFSKWIEMQANQMMEVYRPVEDQIAFRISPRPDVDFSKILDENCRIAPIHTHSDLNFIEVICQMNKNVKWINFFRLNEVVSLKQQGNSKLLQGADSSTPDDWYFRFGLPLDPLAAIEQYRGQ